MGYMNMVGMKFGKLTIIRQVERPEHLHAKKTRFWECECECGNIIIASTHTLHQGKVKRCKECKNKLLKGTGHQSGMSGTRIYRIWHNIIHRCDNPNFISYKDYGAKGISYCDRWKDFLNFYEDMFSTYKDGLQIDRIDNNKGYSPENCRWVTPQENQRNKSTNVYLTWHGKRMLIIDWCRSYGTHIYRQIKKHRYDGTMIIEGGKYNNV